MEFEKEIKILDFEDKISTVKKAPFTRFKTFFDNEEKWMSCFVTEIIPELKALRGAQVKVKISQIKSFTNITGIVKGIDSKIEKVSDFEQVVLSKLNSIELTLKTIALKR